MAAPPTTGNPASMLDRAVAAWLLAQNCNYIDGTNTAIIAPAYTNIVKVSYPVIEVYSTRSDNQPQQTGIKLLRTEIRHKQSAVTEVDAENPENQRVILDQLVGQVLAQMLLSNDGSTLDYTAQNITTAGRALAANGNGVAIPGWAQGQNNQDMANFTLEKIYDRGQARGNPEEEGTAWAEVLNFDCSVVTVQTSP